MIDLEKRIEYGEYLTATSIRAHWDMIEKLVEIISSKPGTPCEEVRIKGFRVWAIEVSPGNFIISKIWKPGKKKRAWVVTARQWRTKG